MRIRTQVLVVATFTVLSVLLLVGARMNWLRPSPSDGAPDSGAAVAESAETSLGSADGTPNSDQRSMAPLPVSGVVARRGPFVLEVHGTGRAEAVRRAELSSRVGERVRAVSVQPGQHVAAGQVLLELDSRPFELTLREAQGARGRAELEFESQVFADTNGSEERRERIADRVGLTESRQRVERAELDLESVSLRAPFSGDVVSVSAAVGERIQAEQALVTIVSVDPIRIPAEVLEADFGRLRVGAPATVEFPALVGELFLGTIAALGPEIDPARGTGVAYLQLQNPEGRIRPGMYAEVALAADLLGDRVSVPRDAVLERDRRTMVFRVHQGRAEWSYVDTGLENDDAIEILSGVADGDTVLIGGHLTLAHGAPVQVKVEG